MTPADQQQQPYLSPSPYGQQSYPQYYSQVYGYNTYNQQGYPAQQQQQVPAPKAESTEEEEEGGGYFWLFALLAVFIILVLSGVIIYGAKYMPEDTTKYRTCDENSRCVPRCCDSEWTCMNFDSLEGNVCVDQTACLKKSSTVSACMCKDNRCTFS